MFPYTDWLAEEKKRRDLGEAAIGQIDTGSFMMKLFLLGGFRGIVADCSGSAPRSTRRDHDWDRLKPTVELITKLQPHFLSIWTFQGWNLAYNVAVEWDAPEDKYEWIKQGIKFVQEGVEQEPAVARPDLGHGLVLLPQAGLLRRVDHPPPAVPRRRGRGLQDATTTPRPTQRGQATTTSSWVTAGSAGPSRWSTRARAARPRARPRTSSRSSTSTRPPAEGAARRHRLPLDARPRADPLRRRLWRR